MESRLKVSGNGIQPMLVLFPLGLFVTALIFDLFYLLGGPTLLAETAYWTVVGGLFAGTMAAVAGLVDLFLLQSGSRARREAVAHGLINGGVLMLFAVIWLVRVGAEHRAAGVGLFLIELVILISGAVSAWLAGELVDRLGPDATPEASFTLRGRAVDLLGHLVSAR